MDDVEASKTSSEPAEELTAKESGTADWYYTVDSVRHGPISTLAMQDFVNKRVFDETTLVWRKGMKQWVPIRDSELGVFISSGPPPLPPNFVGDLSVWIIVLLPLAFGAVDATTRDIYIFIPATANAALCFVDAILLKRAGYDAKLIGAAIVGFILVPVYLYSRARQLRQRPYAAIAWLVTTILGALIYGLATT
jgi:hypothetical protein